MYEKIILLKSKEYPCNWQQVEGKSKAAHRCEQACHAVAAIVWSAVIIVGNDVVYEGTGAVHLPGNN